MIDTKFVERIARELSVDASQVAKAIELLDGGATGPFVARFRNDATGNLSEAQLDMVAERNAFFTGFVNRRNSILQTIEKQGKLTDELRATIEGCEDKASLEDLYLPFKNRRMTKATLARQKGLEPLAERLLNQAPADQDIQRLATGFISSEKAVSSVEEALEGACFIISERIVMDPKVRGMIRAHMLTEGRITSRSTKNAEGKKTKFEAYYNFAEPVATIPSHRMLAILRGVKMGVLRMDLTIHDDQVFSEVLALYVEQPGSSFEPHLHQALEDAYYRHLRPALEHDVIEMVRQRAEKEAIRVFEENTRNLLLAPPAGPIVVLGVEPGLRTGCKLAVVDDSGGLLETRTIQPHPPESDAEGAARTVLELVEKYRPKAIAVGNGTAARETSQFFNQLIAKHALKDILCVIVNAVGTSVYATSKSGREEFPELDPSMRGAISVARRLQNPLAELVKVEPRQVGVGQYHHDVHQRQLREGLYHVVVSCVNLVGADLNKASVELLRYVSGINMGTAQNLVMRRNEIGGFKSREQLKEVDGIGAKAFEQCAGFLRLPGAENPLDATFIHPESYPVVEKIAASLNVGVGQLVRNRDLIETVDFSKFTDGVAGPHTLKDIREQLLRPGRDPRKRFRAPRFIDGITSFDDLKEGMEMEGVVTNVTDFGAFVDIGMNQDGLVHLSQMANRFVSDPRQIVKVGEIVKVKIIKLDKDVPRISLSMKAVSTHVKKRPRKPPVRREEVKPQEGTTERPAAVQPSRPRRGGQPDTRNDGRAERERRPKQEDGRRPSPPARDRDRGRDGDRGRDRTTDRRPPRRSERAREPQRAVSHADSKESLNTLLADQLAAIRDRFK